MFPFHCLTSLKDMLRAHHARNFKRYRKQNRHTSPDLAQVSVSKIITESLEDRMLLTAFTVLNANDSGTGSLREAIELANSNAGADTISFDATLTGQTIVLSNELEITDDLTITGLGADQLTLDGDNNSRIFNIDDGNNATTITVEISGLTLKNGNSNEMGATPDGNGGAILSFEDLTVKNSTLSGNSARLGGGAIYASYASLTIENSLITDNEALLHGGGGIYYWRSGGSGLNVSESTFSHNSAIGGAGRGGAIFFNEGVASILNSTFTENSADVGGAGIYNNVSGSMTIESTLLTKNVSGNNGGALYNSNELFVYNSTLSENSALHVGSGIYSFTTATLEVVNSTIVLNYGRSPLSQGGAIYGSNLNPFIITNSIIAGNTAVRHPQIAGIYTDTSNIISGSISGLIDPILRDNGGPTQTHSLLVGSPAINAGDNTAATNAGLTYDQRGSNYNRIKGGTVDLGAYEVQLLHTQIDLRTVDSKTSIQNNGESSSLPENLGWLDEWSSYWIEIWISTPSTTDLDIQSVAFNLSYNTAITTAISIEYGPAFTSNQTGTINDVTGTIENLSAETNLTDVGDDQHVLFARIRFEPTSDEVIDLNLQGQSLNPQSPEFSIGQSEILFAGGSPSEEVHGSSPETQIWANPYDLNDDDVINFDDLTIFASTYKSIPSESDSNYAWFADLNKNDKVDFDDLVLFVSNYSKSKLDQTSVIYPEQFPEAWSNLLIVNAQTAPQPEAEPITQSTAETVLEDVVEQVSPELTADEVETLENTEIQVVDLQGDVLGRAVPGTIYIDVNAAGYGWFVDSTPGEHSEFEHKSQLSLIALPESEAAGKVDLWTVIMHELGHILGREHVDEGVMQETLAPGVRNLPVEAENETDDFFTSLKDDSNLIAF